MVVLDGTGAVAMLVVVSDVTGVVILKKLICQQPFIRFFPS